MASATPPTPRSLDKSELAEQLADGPLYWHVGAGLSIGAGLPSWDDAVRIVWNFLQDPIYPEPLFGFEAAPAAGREAEKFLAEFQNDAPNGVCLLRRSNRDSRTLGRLFLLNILFRHRSPNPPDGVRQGELPTDDDCAAHRALWRTRPHGVFTTNYDTLLESMWDYPGRPRKAKPKPIRTGLRVYRYSATFLEHIVTNKQFVLKLHGDVDDLREMLLDPSELWEKDAATTLREVLLECATQGHFIILGASLQDFTGKELLKVLASAPRHKENIVRAVLFSRKDWEKNLAQTDIARRVEVLLFDEHADIPDILAAISERRAGVSLPSCDAATKLWRKVWSPERQTQ